MSPATQTKILRALQEGEISRIGASKTTKVDVRMLAATHRDLDRMVAEGSFREDLYYRLNVVRIDLPPLRERPEDIPQIVDFLLRRLVRSGKGKARRISTEGLEILRRHSWPGNVRELENVLQRSAVTARGETILAGNLPEELRRQETVSASPPAASGIMAVENTARQFLSSSQAQIVESERNRATLSDTLDVVYKEIRKGHNQSILRVLEKEIIQRALRETGGNQVRSAALLGISRGDPAQTHPGDWTDLMKSC